ncbi:hypothetical protein SELMODRAFT_422833 [Selaginella moellendorffii]|uniref:Uncharacterized protein n=1 Tax=Selaginella moellendorffii TaxID=88036 RepID=D8SJP5_SELML|nr:hypothetical protein SELMODRAFT_422833 [Selaginella moellendorffii]
MLVMRITRTRIVDTKAHYQLNFLPKVGVKKNFYAMPQVFVSGCPAIHVYTMPEQEIQVASFVFEEDHVEMKFRAYYMVDGDDYDSWGSVGERQQLFQSSGWLAIFWLERIVLIIVNPHNGAHGCSKHLLE